MKLPNGHKADLGNKIDEYCLNPNHFKGKHKAHLFKAKLGVTLDNSEILKKALREAAIISPVTIRKTNQFGTHYNLKFFLKTEAGESIILAAWIIRHGEDFPRLTNCYPINK